MNAAALLRKKILRIIHLSGASHVGSSLSVVEILNAVYSLVNIDKIRQMQNDRDRIVLSKGHAAAALYAVLNYYDLMDDKLLETYYSNGSMLGGHASHPVKFVEHSTGALGHGLPVGVGMALGMVSRNLNGRVFVIVGDGEMQEGSNWEAIMLAAHLGLNNLCVLVDYNKLGGIGETQKCCNLDSLRDKLMAFGFDAYDVNGHCEEEITGVIDSALNKDRPVGIVCHTIKGKGISFMENENVWHYRPPDSKAYAQAIMEIENQR